MEEKIREISTLSRQLDTAIQDGKRSAESQQLRMANKEKSNQARIMELEAQLARNKAELSQLRRAKEEVRLAMVALRTVRKQTEQ